MSTFKVRVYGYMVKGLTAGKMVAPTSNTADDLFNLPPGYSVNDDINDPNCGLPIDAVEDNIFVNCFEFSIGEPDSVQELNILLGESKYFYAISDPNDNTKLQIKEYDAEDSIPSTLPNGGISDAFSTDNFVEIISGDKAGIYWERKGAIISDKGEITTADLPEGMIRVIGRYWEADQVFSVKLKATSSNRSGELEIKITKPARLGTEYAKAKDVFDNVINVDSLIITNAGKYGIPPQLIKAQIFREANKVNFGNEIGNGFAPSWRYEPYTGQFGNSYFKYWSGNFFIEDSLDADFSDVPIHSHLSPHDYYRELKTIWDIVKEESQLVDASNSNNYGTRNTDGKMNFGKYTTIQSEYEIFYSKFEDVSDLSEKEKADSARINFINYFKKDWKEVGAENIIAQTRTATSYGYLQILYTNACWLEQMSGCFIPEKLNDTELFSIPIKLQLKYMLDKYPTEWTKQNWKNGYEASFRTGVLNRWNQSSSYTPSVIEKMNDFKPTRN